MKKSTVDISFIIINWNTGHLLNYCVPSLLKQSQVNAEIILIDNNSSDETKIIANKLDPSVRVVLNEENLGYSGAANQGIRLSQGRYVSIINPDVILSNNYAAEIIKQLDESRDVASATGKLIKYDFKNRTSLNILDTTGIEIERDLRMFDRGQNSSELEKFDEDLNVFGVSGAAPIYRRDALEDIKILDEYFDEDFLAYKEDIDLSWRFRSYGWQALFVPNAIAFHGRAVSGTGNRSKLQFIKNRKGQSSFLKKISLRNHYCLLVKNLTFNDFIKNLFPIVKREFMHLVYSFVFEFKTLAGLVEFFGLLPKMIKKRKLIRQEIDKRQKESTVFFTH